MKKITPNPPDITDHFISHIFTILPNIDTATLLAHASETLASLNVMATDLAFQLEGSRRNLVLALQQMTVLSELLVNRALDRIDPPDSPCDAQPTSPH
ncbi:DUF6124 family protein [Pseudomonas sp. SZMC_28357]|uniref:DUF6124 family protein n=1 Tax=Pseudomonas sp. SZMC_28357 TaxID=3074380 RepID=UPI00287149A9|nr:DUF6124 family protein [Pseudomonas sp. SZMC_28357]MDR9754445.1 DUF6124 family protein [Pseudomonas sp. SZMC_28357]